MAQMRYQPIIETADIAWLGEAPNYNTLMPHGAMFNPAGVNAVDRAVLTTSGATAAGSKTIALAAKINNSEGIAAGTTLTFGAVAVVLSQWASPEATTLNVYPTSAIIADAAAATFAGVGARPLRAGTAVGRTYAERDAGAMFELAADTDDEIYLVAFDIPDLTVTIEIALVRHGVRIKENRLPGFTALAAAVKAKLRDLYQMYKGT